MRRVIKIGSFLWLLAAQKLMAAAEFSLNDPAHGLFDKETKVVKGFYTIEWMVKGSAAIFAITCFVSAGNMARQGNYGRAVGAVIGGVISAIGGYLVATAQS